MALPQGMEHIDRKSLYTSLRSRISYLHTFLEFDRDDINALNDGQKYIKQAIPHIVDMVYRKLLRHDITARVFSTRDSRVEENPEVWVTEESEKVKRRKLFLKWYLSKLNEDPGKMEFWQYLDKVGFMHVGRGRRHPLHVEYIFLGACLGYIQDSLTEAILLHPTIEMSKKVAIVKAFGKVVWIQNDLLARWHTEEGKEFRDKGDGKESGLMETEDCLHDRRIFKEDCDSDGTSIISADAGKTSLGRTTKDIEQADEASSRCPFSGMTNIHIGDIAYTASLERQRMSSPIPVRPDYDATD